MRQLSRGCQILLVGLLLATTARADLIFLKDGHVLQGTVKRDFSISYDSTSRTITNIPKGFLRLDDGARRIYFSPLQVRVVERSSNPIEERVVSTKMRSLLTPLKMPPILEILDSKPWDNTSWERDLWFRTGNNRVGVRQAIASMNPQFVRVDAITKFAWQTAYLTREFDPQVLLGLLKGNPALAPNSKDTPAQLVTKHMRVCDFLAQAGFYDLAEKELAALLAQHPDQSDRVTNAKNMIDRLRLREDWERLKQWHNAGRSEAVLQELDQFAKRNLPDRMKADMRELRGKLESSRDLVTTTSTALEATAKEATSVLGKTLASAVAVILTEIHASNVDRLDTFLSQYREAERHKARKSKPQATPEELLALAISGWLLGAPASETNPVAAVSLWQTRQMILEYLGEKDATSRAKILTDFEKRVSPRPQFDEIAQMIPTLPPVEALKVTPNKVIEAKVGAGRNVTNYSVILPPEYTHNRPYPLLVALHNGGEKPETTISRFRKIAADHGYILLVPEWLKGLANEYSYNESEHDSVLLSIRDVQRKYMVDSDRIFLHGFGEGGKAAFDIGLSHPGIFAGVLPMSAGPERFPKRYWRNAQYLPFYVVSGFHAGDSGKLLSEQFSNWIQRGFPALWVEYKGRGTEFFSAELPNMFDWMRCQKRVFPLKQLGTDGMGSEFGTEFCTLRINDDRFYWLSTSNIRRGNLVASDGWTVGLQPAAMCARVDNETIYLKTQGLLQVSLWIGRDSNGQYNVDINKPLTVFNGLQSLLTKRKVTPSLSVMLEDLYSRNDRTQLFVARLDFNLR